MPNSMNKVILLGHVGKDPLIKELPSGKMAQFPLATNRRWRDKSGELKEHTEWHNICIFGSAATTVENYVHKGSRVLVDGEIRTRSYDSGGTKKYVVEVHSSSIILLDKKNGKGTDGDNNDDELPF